MRENKYDKLLFFSLVLLFISVIMLLISGYSLYLKAFDIQNETSVKIITPVPRQPNDSFYNIETNSLVEFATDKNLTATTTPGEDKGVKKSGE